MGDMTPEAGQSELRKWYELLRSEAPVAALGLALLGAALLLLLMSGSLADSVAHILSNVSIALFVLGLFALALGVIITAWKQAKRE